MRSYSNVNVVRFVAHHENHSVALLNVSPVWKNRYESLFSRTST